MALGLIAQPFRRFLPSRFDRWKKVDYRPFAVSGSYVVSPRPAARAPEMIMSAIASQRGFKVCAEPVDAKPQYPRRPCLRRHDGRRAIAALDPQVVAVAGEVMERSIDPVCAYGLRPAARPAGKARPSSRSAAL